MIYIEMVGSLHFLDSHSPSSGRGFPCLLWLRPLPRCPSALCRFDPFAPAHPPTDPRAKGVSQPTCSSQQKPTIIFFNVGTKPENTKPISNSPVLAISNSILWSLWTSIQIANHLVKANLERDGDARLRPLIKIFEIDSQLLALLVEMAALQPQCFGSLGDVPVVPLQFPEYLSAFKGRDPLGEWSRSVRGAYAGRRPRGMSGGQSQLNRLGIDHGSCEQQEPLDDIAQLADIARPGVLLE